MLKELIGIEHLNAVLQSQLAAAQLVRFYDPVQGEDYAVRMDALAAFIGSGGGGGVTGTGTTGKLLKWTNGGGAVAGDSIFSESGSVGTVTGTLVISGNTLTIRSVAYTFPAADGTSGQALTTNGSGVLSWTTISGGGISGLTTGKLAKAASSTTLADSLVSESGSVVTVTGALVVSGNTLTIRSVAYTFPAADGSNGQVLTTNGSGALTWTTVSGAGISGLTTGTVPKAASSTTIGDSNITISGSVVTITGSLVMTGSINLADQQLLRPEFRDTAETLHAIGNSGASQTLDHTVADNHSLTLNATCTLTLTNPPATGILGRFTIYITGDGTHNITYPGSVTWDAAGAPPVPANGAIQVVELTTTDAGTNYLGTWGGISAENITAGTLAIARGGTGVTTAPGNGKLLIGNNSGGYTVANLTAGSNVTITNGDGTITIAASGGGGGGTVQPSVSNGVLTLESGVPFSITDQSAKTSVLFTPYKGNHISLYTSSTWTDYTFAELSLALGTLTNNTNYDVFCYDVGAAATLILGPAWSSDTARGTGAGTTELTLQDGVLVNANDITSGPTALSGRYLGTIRTSSTTTTEDTVLQRYVYTLGNPRPKTLSCVDTTDNWAYSSATVRQANGSTANKVEFVIGYAGAVVDGMLVAGIFQANLASKAVIGIGVDSITAFSSRHASSYAAIANEAIPACAKYAGAIGIGYHYVAWLERAGGTFSTTFLGDDGGYISSGLTVVLHPV